MTRTLETAQPGMSEANAPIPAVQSGAVAWRPMKDAPRDGTEIEALCVHRNAMLSEDAVGDGWVEIVRAHWIDHNGGGWTWNGIAGQFLGWRPAPQSEPLPGGVGEVIGRAKPYWSGSGNKFWSLTDADYLALAALLSGKEQG